MQAPGHQNDQVTSVACAVLTVSDTRTAEPDSSGKLIRELLTGAGHTIHAYSLRKDDPPVIRETPVGWRDDPACQAVLITGGTGLAACRETVEGGDVLVGYERVGVGRTGRRTAGGGCPEAPPGSRPRRRGGPQPGTSRSRRSRWSGKRTARSPRHGERRKRRRRQPTLTGTQRCGSRMSRRGHPARWRSFRST